MFLRTFSGARYIFRSSKSVSQLKVSPVTFARTKSSVPSTERGPSEVADVTDDKPLTNKPFAKDLFLGKFDTQVLDFPELSQEELSDLNQMVQPIEKYFNEALDSDSIDVNAKIPDEVLQDIKDLGLFGQQIPEEYGGLGLNATKFARLAEITALDGSIAVTLAAHQSIGLKGILIAGNDEQKQKYLPKLATGEHVAAFCLTEPSSGSDAASIQTKATLSEDGKTFYLNGGKIWISNGGIADIMTVFAKTEVEKDGEKVEKVTAFIVEREFGGVTNGKPEDKLGIRGSNTCEVHFENTPVPIENVIGEVGGGFKIAMNILNSGRFSMGSSGAGILKKLIGMTAEHAMTRKQFGQHLSEFGLIQSKFAKMAVTTYVMESMAYLTAGTIDQYKKPDLSVEAAIVKIFSSEGCWASANECLQILGGLGYMKDYPYERYLRDGRILMIFEGTNEILRLYISLAGMQHAGKFYKDLIKSTVAFTSLACFDQGEFAAFEKVFGVKGAGLTLGPHTFKEKKLRNPIQNPSLLFKTSFKKMFPSSAALNLPQFVHPELKKETDILETSVLVFNTLVQHLLTQYGNNIVKMQMELERVANILVDLYGMTACIARCNRSLCIGLKNSDHEKLLTATFCMEAQKRIRDNETYIKVGPVLNNDENYTQIANQMFKEKGYAATHPLERNW